MEYYNSKMDIDIVPAQSFIITSAAADCDTVYIHSANHVDKPIVPGKGINASFWVCPVPFVVAYLKFHTYKGRVRGLCHVYGQGGSLAQSRGPLRHRQLAIREFS